MAYLDHRTGSSERAAAFTLVTALQVGVFSALVHGLAVAFLPQADAPTTIAEHIALAPPPAPQDIADPTEQQAAPPPRNTGQQRTASDTADLVIAPPETLADKAARPGDAITGGMQPPLPPSNLAKAARPTSAPAGWVTQNDYPAVGIRAEHQGTTRFTLGIGADGKVTSCTVIASSGFASLDAATCKYVRRRASFEPALNAAGEQAASSYTNSIRWVIPV